MHMIENADQPEQPQPAVPTVYPGGFTAPPSRSDVFTGYTPDPDRVDPDRWPNVLVIEPGEDEDTDGRFVPVIRVETNYKPSGRVGDTYPVNLTFAEAIRAAASLLYKVGDGINELDDRLPALQLVTLATDLQGLEESLNELREGLLSDLEYGLKQAATTADTTAAADADAREIDERERVATDTTTTTTEGTSDVAE